MNECSGSASVFFLSEQCSLIQLALFGGGYPNWGESLSVLKRSGLSMWCT